MKLSDHELLHLYLHERSERAFTELVERHINLVFSTALRRLNGDPELARDVCQAVFTDLAGKAHALASCPTLVGWLYTSTRFAAVNALRSEQRRRLREGKATCMSPPESAVASNLSWEHLRPVLDKAMHDLGEQDREALLLRFFQDHSYQAVGQVLHLSEDAARKRVDRALEKLRCVLQRRGIDSTRAALEAALASAATILAPKSLVAAVVTKALVGTTAHFTTASLISLASLKAGIIGAIVLATLSATILLQRNTNTKLRSENKTLQSALAAAQDREAHRKDAAPPMRFTPDDSHHLENHQPSVRAQPAVTGQQTLSESPGETQRPLQTDNEAYELALAALRGEMSALDKLDAMTIAAVHGEQPDLATDKAAVSRKKLRAIDAAFQLFVDEADRGNTNALGLIAQALRLRGLSGFGAKSLGDLAGHGSEGALNILLDPGKFGVDIPLSGTVGALKPAAENGNERAIQALAQLGESDSCQPLWLMAAEALRVPAESGHPAAIEALISFSRTTNANTLTAVRAGLSAAAATQNPRAIEALNQLIPVDAP
ncbi:MAG: sigma-70 family RNA polymerase sigma factor [Verrucomicrobiota bacterium]